MEFAENNSAYEMFDEEEEEEPLVEEGSVIEDWEIGKVIDRGAFSTLYFTKKFERINIFSILCESNCK